MKFSNLSVFVICVFVIPDNLATGKVPEPIFAAHVVSVVALVAKP
jgi:hypothetical protein